MVQNVIRETFKLFIDLKNNKFIDLFIYSRHSTYFKKWMRNKKNTDIQIQIVLNV